MGPSVSFPPALSQLPKSYRFVKVLGNHFGKLPDTVTDFYFELIRKALANTLYWIDYHSTENYYLPDPTCFRMISSQSWPAWMGLGIIYHVMAWLYLHRNSFPRQSLLQLCCWSQKYPRHQNDYMQLFLFWGINFLKITTTITLLNS